MPLKKKNTQADCARLVFVLSNGPMSDHSSSSFVPLCFAWLKSCASNFCRERRTTSPSITICLHRLIYIILPWQVWRSWVWSVENETTNGIMENLRPVSLLWHVCGCRTKSRIMKDTQKIPNLQKLGHSVYTNITSDRIPTSIYSRALQENCGQIFV